MLDRYDPDPTVTVDGWSLPTAAGDGSPAAAHVVAFALEHGMDGTLLAGAGGVVSSVFANSAARLGDTNGHRLAVDAATDGDWLSVRITGDDGTVTIELPMTVGHGSHGGTISR